MLTAVVDLPTPPLPDATAMIASMPGTPRRPWVCDAGAGGAARGAAAPGAAMARWLRRRRWPLDRSFHAPALLFGSQRNDRAGNAGHRLYSAFGGGPQWLKFLRAGGGNRYREKDLGIGDENFRDEAERDDIALEIRTLDGPQLLNDGFAGNGRHGSSASAGLAALQIVQIAPNTKPRCCSAGCWRAFRPVYRSQTFFPVCDDPAARCELKSFCRMLHEMLLLPPEGGPNRRH